MNKAVLLYTDSDTFAGTERHILDLARGLRGLEVAVAVACPSPSALEDAAKGEKIETLTIQKRGLVDWAAIGTLAGLLRSGAVQVVHAHNGRTALAAALAVRRAGRGRCVMTQHFLEPNHATQRGPKAWVSQRAHHWVVEQMSAILAISEAVRQGLLNRREAPEEKIVVVPNGIAAPERPLPTQSAALRRSLGIAPDAPVIVCAARLEPEKDIASLVSAMTQVQAALPAAHCLLAGTGSQRDLLAAQIGRLGLDGCVHLLGFRPDAHALIASADVFALPSLAEPFGLALLEAMALGVPVVATRAGGPMEIVVEGQTGLLVPPSSPSALAEAICALLTRPDRGRQMGENGRTRFLECFTAERMASATLSVYQSLAKAG